MIVDIRELPDGSDVAADLLIIGGGMAGIALARQWAGGAKTVAILESGGRERDEATQALYAGKATLAGDGNPEAEINDYLVDSRARFYGGSGNWWGGKCVPLDPADFAARPWIENSGWPISRADLQPYYDRACELLEIPRFDKDYAEPQHEGRPPLDVNSSVHVTSLPRVHTEITGGVKARYDEFRYGFTDAANVSVYLHASVVDFNLSADRSRLESVGIATLEGKRYTARGAAYVLACGGIENARLLLAANARNGANFGHRSRALGRYFQGHTVISKRRADTHSGTRVHFSNPPASLSLYVDRQPGRPHAVLGTTLAGQARYQSAAFTVTMGLDPTPGAVDERAVRVTATRIDRADVDADGDVGCWCYFMTENLPNAESRVTLTHDADSLGMPRVELRWLYGAEDLDHFERSVDAFARELGASGVGRTSCPVERNEVIGLMSPSRHHMGTTRMHANPAVGVVDANLKLHDASNLYITGSSVFPTSGIANPTLTIFALTLRLSDHLREELGR